ncbi:hypothetical protein JZ751_022985 [Albula glossodonta]|uniref:Uncharacterized protein n=1 Tax=Albula glossodonta TaxID=121402 RepID=A0A8T2PGW4_9TELE|nr:hypothetical protein JZ751_022985 [Albula glossodonta]
MDLFISSQAEGVLPKASVYHKLVLHLGTSRGIYIPKVNIQNFQHWRAPTPKLTIDQGISHY